MTELVGQKSILRNPSPVSGEEGAGGIRLDQPHPEPPAPVTSPHGISTGSVREEFLLLQAGQITDHLKRKVLDLDRKEQRLNAQLALVDEEKKNIRLWIAQVDSQIQDRESALQQREQICQEREKAISDSEQALQEERLRLLRIQTELESERQSITKSLRASEAEISIARERQLSDFQARERALTDEFVARQAQLSRDYALRKEELEQRLSSGLTEMETTRDELNRLRNVERAEIEQLRLTQENRFRFQEAHLKKMRSDIEQTRSEFRLESQERQAWLIERRRMLDLYREQLIQVRNYLDKRAESIQRETALCEERLESSRRMMESERLQHNQVLGALQKDQEASLSELAHQRDLLAKHAETLEARRIRMDKLRSEIEETHRQTLELRMAVEESCAQLGQWVGAEQARQRIEEAKNQLAEGFRHSRLELIELRKECESSQMTLERQREEFRAERQLLSEWARRKEEEFQRASCMVAEQRKTVEQQERWLEEASRLWQKQRQSLETQIQTLSRDLEKHLLSQQA